MKVIFPKLFTLFILSSSWGFSFFDLESLTSQKLSFNYSENIKFNSTQNTYERKLLRLAQAGEFSQIVLKFLEKSTPTAFDDLSNEGKFIVAESFFQTKRFNTSLKIFRSLMSSTVESDLLQKIRIRVAMTMDQLSYPEYMVDSAYKLASKKISTEDLSIEAKVRYLDYKLKDKDIKLKNVFFDQFGLDDIKLQENSLALKLKRFMRLKLLVMKEDFKTAQIYVNALPDNFFTDNSVGTELAKKVTMKSLLGFYEEGKSRLFFSLFTHQGEKLFNMKDLKKLNDLAYKLELKDRVKKRTNPFEQGA